jgi:YD repeat-containing protein
VRSGHHHTAGNRIHPDDTRDRPLERAAPGNRLHRSAHARYRHDAWGNVVQIDHTAGQLKGQQVRLAYDGEHRLLASERIQTNTDGQRHSVLTRYHYDPMSRRVGKQHLRRISQGEGQKSEWHIQSSLWFGWDGDRMVTMQNDRQASTTIYEPGSFVPMIRVDKQLQADDRRAKGETRTYHVHCNHLGTPEALIAQDSLELVWQIELDPWGQTQREYTRGLVQRHPTCCQRRACDPIRRGYTKRGGCDSCGAHQVGIGGRHDVVSQTIHGEGNLIRPVP